MSVPPRSRHAARIHPARRTRRHGIDVAPLWNFSDPAGSEQRFRQALAGASSDDALELQTQIARTYGMRRASRRRAGSSPASRRRSRAPAAQPQVRWHLELGRTYASPVHRPEDITPEAREKARSAYTQAFEKAKAARLDYLAIDALHMMVMVDAGAGRTARLEREGARLHGGLDPGRGEEVGRVAAQQRRLRLPPRRPLRRGDRPVPAVAGGLRAQRPRRQRAHRPLDDRPDAAPPGQAPGGDRDPAAPRARVRPRPASRIPMSSRSWRSSTARPATPPGPTPTPPGSRNPAALPDERAALR